jgi:hypothetical protein
MADHLQSAAVAKVVLVAKEIPVAKVLDAKVAAGPSREDPSREDPSMVDPNMVDPSMAGSMAVVVPAVSVDLWTILSPHLFVI